MSGATRAPEAFGLREAHESDEPGIAELHAASWASAYRGSFSDAFLDGPVFANRRDVWRKRFAAPDPNRIIVVADGAGPGLAGFCCILGGHHPALGSLIDNLHVRPGLTRNRLGRVLLQAATARLAAGPHAATPLHITVLDANARAIAAYEGWGGGLDAVIDSQEQDGSRHRVRRYVWPDPATLLAGLDRAKA